MSERRKGWQRREVMAAAGAGALALGGSAFLARRLSAQPLAGFTHGVASGEPEPRSMLFWTRFVAPGDRPVPLTLEVATDPRMTRVLARGETLAEPSRDRTARLALEGLEPARTYYYRWTGPGRARSVVGRTRTLPEGPTALFRLGVFSCSNLPFGWFNAYAEAAAADDFELAVHLGDYIYEYPRGTYPSPDQAVAGRVSEPPHATVRLEDYWARYRSYRADPDLQALHARQPMVAIWDDHEVANDSWMQGAQNHDPATEGSWSARLSAGMAAWRDWMPMSDDNWAAYALGDLGTLYRLDTRLSGRDQPLDYARAVAAGPDVGEALVRLRDEQWVSGERQLLGERQEEWLAARMAEGARRTRWQVLAQQVVMGRLKAPRGLAAALPPTLPPELRQLAQVAEAASALGLPFNLDAWDGYPAARARLLGMAQAAGAELVVLSGDSHNGWAFDLEADGRPAGVEFGVPSVTSPGLEAYLPLPPAGLGQALVGANNELRWADTARRGWLHLTLAPEVAAGEWRFSAPVVQRSAAAGGRASASVARGQRRLTLA